MKHIPKSEDVYVIMHGRMLKRSETLHSCVVSDGCTIQITSRFRGEEGTRTKRTKRKRNEAWARVDRKTSMLSQWAEFSAGFGVLFSTRLVHLIRLFLFVVGSVAIHVVHVNANLFHSRKIDQFRMLSSLSLEITAIFTTGCTLPFVSTVL